MQGDPVTDAGGREDPYEVRPLYAVLAIVIGVAALAILILAVDPLRSGISDAISGDTDNLREDLRGLGAGGVLITFVLALAHVVIWYPAEILDLAVGYVYGFWGGLLVAMAGWLANALVAYWIGRHAARPALYRFVSRQRFDRLEQAVEAGGATLLLGIRLVPVIPFSLFSMAAGAARANLYTFVWTTIVGYLPLTIVFVYLGSQLEELSPTDPILWLGAAVLIALLVVSHRVRNRWGRGQPESAAEGQPEPEPEI
jgi:uncharacterized membrane protein YdjX (TVP38/TMEM64 family)